MDFTLRCNSLKCRMQLMERAVVTTCSHIFCTACCDLLGLSAPAGVHRLCPACHTALPNPDDVVSTQLNPTEDYKTSVLSGLSPSTIMECAGRALAFWSYQSTQEIVYQEYLAKTLTDKYANLNVQMDKIINDANSELEVLNQKLSMMQMDQDKLKAENSNLVAAFREKNRKHQQTQELYDRLKRKEMTAQTQSAAYDSVDQVLGSVTRRHNHDPLAPIEPYQSIPRPQGQRAAPHYPVDHNGVEQLHTHQRSGSNGSRDSRGRMPPPFGHPAGDVNTMPPPPTQHRARVGPMSNSASRVGMDSHRSVTGPMGTSQMQTPSHRQPFVNVTGNSVNRSSVSGYGMSAGLKVGRQQASRSGGFAHPSQGRDGGRLMDHPREPQRFPQNNSSYY